MILNYNLEERLQEKFHIRNNFVITKRSYTNLIRSERNILEKHHGGERLGNNFTVEKNKVIKIRYGNVYKRYCCC